MCLLVRTETCRVQSDLSAERSVKVIHDPLLDRLLLLELRHTVGSLFIFYRFFMLDASATRTASLGAV